MCDGKERLALKTASSLNNSLYCFRVLVYGRLGNELVGWQAGQQRWVEGSQELEYVPLVFSGHITVHATYKARRTFKVAWPALQHRSLVSHDTALLILKLTHSPHIHAPVLTYISNNRAVLEEHLDSTGCLTKQSSGKCQSWFFVTLIITLIVSLALVSFVIILVGKEGKSSLRSFSENQQNHMGLAARREPDGLHAKTGNIFLN
ncbi:Leucine-rich single-pass membrane protein 1 [Varanus komodoensis]|nr:Leucine-rich single-pass membrane protein 1 [Varanus komodoensis]